MDFKKNYLSCCFNWLKHMYYALPFGLKGAEDEIMLSKVTSISDASTIQEHVQESNLGADLLKGEITQEVIEFRYQTYKVYKESNKYKTQGGITKKVKEQRNNGKLIQTNKESCINILDSFSDNKSLTDNSYTLLIDYIDIPKFRLDKLCTFFEVINNDNENVIKLHFEKQYDVSQITTRVFTSELKNLVQNMKNNNNIDKIFSTHEFFANIKNIKFITHQAYGEDDLMEYNLVGIQGVGLIDTKYEYIITYDVDKIEKIDLTAQFYSKEAQDKYDIGAEKKMAIRGEKGALNKCSVCGSDVNIYDASITEDMYGEILCVNCLNKKILSERG